LNKTIRKIISLALAMAVAVAVFSVGFKPEKVLAASSTYSIVYQPNCGSGRPVVQTAYVNRSVKLRSQICGNPNYYFLGWSTDKNAVARTYRAGQYVKNLAAAGRSITLYAVWIYKDYYSPSGKYTPKSTRQTTAVNNILKRQGTDYVIATASGANCAGWAYGYAFGLTPTEKSKLYLCKTAVWDRWAKYLVDKKGYKKSQYSSTKIYKVGSIIDNGTHVGVVVKSQMTEYGVMTIVSHCLGGDVHISTVEKANLTNGKVYSK